jgi:hypothetical protein
MPLANGIYFRVMLRLTIIIIADITSLLEAIRDNYSQDHRTSFNTMTLHYNSKTLWLEMYVRIIASESIL